MFKPNFAMDHADYDVDIIKKHHRCFGPVPLTSEKITDWQSLAVVAWV